LHEAQACNDVMAAFQSLRLAYRTDVTPILAEARYKAGGALMPLNAYRSIEWRLLKARHRKSVGLGAGIV
jgi:L-rhamnose isomerase/sugar isomerase